MRYCQTDIDWEVIKECKTKDGQDIRKVILSNIQRNIPVGFNRHKVPQEWSGFNSFPEIDIILEEIDNAQYQLGTLGSGNHFIELQKNQDGKLAIMIHSGSRNFGKKICDRYNAIAKQMNEKWYSSVPSDYGLAFLPTDDDMGREYLSAMNFALEFAHENRRLMMERSKNVVLNMLEKYCNIVGVKFLVDADVHHNYASLENHYGKNVVVHRKGATRAVINKLGIIPGSMGSSSYIVRGRNNPDSFHSCSHGAGRAMGRKEAKRQFTAQQVTEFMKTSDIVILKSKKDDIAEECSWAYKDVDNVMLQQDDLVEIEDKLTPIGVLKG